MALIPSTMLPLDTVCPSFVLPEPGGVEVDVEALRAAPALLVVFLCNHCPYVKHVADELARLGRDCAEWGVAMLGINSNDVATYPADGPEKMIEEKRVRGYVFPYLLDESQSVAAAFQAACTPEAYLFDGARRLVYRGQLDESRPASGVPVTGGDVREAIQAVLAGKPVSERQIPSVGCNIKWKSGNGPALE